MARLYLATVIEGAARRQPWLMRLAWALEAGALALFWGSMALLPPDRASSIGARLFGAIGPRTTKSRHVRRNLEIAFPELSAERREALMVEVWRETGRVFAEYPHLPRIRPDDAAAGGAPRLEVVDNENLRLLLRRGTPTIFATAHLTNWELVARAAAAVGIPVSILHKSQQNPYIYRMVQRWRRAPGCRFIQKSTSAFALTAELKEGRSLGLLLDQRVDGGAFVPFFGVEAETTLVPALLAVRQGFDLTPVRIERLDGGARFRVTVFEPIRPDPALGAAREQARDMLRRLFAHYEDWIRERPHEWLCWKRRWPKTARPVPASMPAAATDGRTEPSLAAGS